MAIVAKIFNSNQRTYGRFYKDAVKRAYLTDWIEVSDDDISMEIIELEWNTIQEQRHRTRWHSRTISVYDNEQLKYIIWVSNTWFDYDKLYEKEQAALQWIELKYVHWNTNYHSNSFICQWINNIFKKYYTEKQQNPNVKLCFYLLDKQTTIPSNLSCKLVYRELATLWFEVINLDGIDFSEYWVTEWNLAYVSFNDFLNDIDMVSRQNRSNNPAYMKRIDDNFDILHDSDYDEEDDEILPDDSWVRYIYTFKALWAEAYDSFLTMRVLYILAGNENKRLQFLFSSEKYNFRLWQQQAKFTTDFPSTITDLFEIIWIDIEYETSEEALQDYNREHSQYLTAKANNKLRNQELFKNNMRERWATMKCCLCWCEIENILEAAHLWWVAEIKDASETTIDNILRNPCFRWLIDETDPDKDTIFYKKYVLANCGENWIRLCRNHHRLLDTKFYQFENTEWRIETENLDNEFFNRITVDRKIPDYLLTERTKLFLLNHSHS